MGKKSKRSAEEAGLVAVEAEGTSAGAVGLPTADVAETAIMDIDGSDEPLSERKKAKKKEKEKREKRDKAGKSDKSDKSLASKKGAAGFDKDKERDELEITADALSPIAHPLAGRKLSKKVLKTVRAAAKARQVKRGTKEVVKALKKSEKGLIVMAADISPMDILSHIPVLCEDATCPYVFITSKELLGQAASTKRPTSCVMICPNSKRKPRKPKTNTKGEVIQQKEPEDYSEAYTDCLKAVDVLDTKVEY